MERPSEEVIATLSGLAETTFAVLARAAWNANRDTWLEVGYMVPDLSAVGPPLVRLGTLWRRDDAVVVPLSWKGDDDYPCFPDFDADIEVVDLYGGTSVHLVGQYELRGARSMPDVARRHRATVVCMRGFLHAVAELLETGYTSVGITA
ncbi:MAG TPA: hypothetical protein VF183_10720 [Acidimicrobiales bacterium]